MREFLTQDTRRTPLEGPYDFMRCFFWCGFHEQIVHLIHRMIVSPDFVSFHVDSLILIDRKG